MAFSYKKIAGSVFEPADTSQWLAKFTEKNNGSKLNLLGEYAPIQDFSFSYETKSLQHSLGITSQELKLPYKNNKPTTISITFFENYLFDITSFFEKMNQDIYRKGRCLALNQLSRYTLDLKIMYFKKDGSSLFTYYLSIVLVDSLTIRGDQEKTLYNLPLTFSVLSFKKQTH